MQATSHLTLFLTSSQFPTSPFRHLPTLFHWSYNWNATCIRSAHAYALLSTFWIFSIIHRRSDCKETTSVPFISQIFTIQVIEGNPAILDDFGIGTFSSSEDVLVTGGGPVTESIQQVNASRVNRDIGMNATSLFIFPSQLRSQLTPDKTTRITFAVYGTPALFSSRYFNDINGNREMFGRRIKRNFGPSTRVVSSTVLSDDKVIREWNGMNGTFQQWYRVLNVSIDTLKRAYINDYINILKSHKM